MDLIKAPSIQSLLDSDLESVDSLQCLDIEELDEVEYALPASETPTLAEALSADDGDVHVKEPIDSALCSALQADFLQGISQQLAQAQERSSAGVATALSISYGGKLTVGTAHGHILSFQDQVLRWVCDSNSDRGAVSCLAYNQDGDRLLVGFARGVLCQYEATKGLVLRRITLGGDIWGILRVTWAGTSGLALDTGGSVWLVKFSRPLGVRSARTSCLFSGARGEVVAMAARDARVLALATLSRVVLVAGGRAAGARLAGPAHTMPVLAWCEADDRLLVCARADTLQWLSVEVSGASISLKPIRQFELKTIPLWLGWVGGSLAIFDVDENLRLWGEDYEKSLDLSHMEPVYASAFFKGLWTDGRVSRAMCAAGGGALGGACSRGGELCLLGRRGVVRVRARDRLSRARALFEAGRYAPALHLLTTATRQDAVALSREFIAELAERPGLLRDKKVADEVVKLCAKLELNEDLWSVLWERCSHENAFVEAIGDSVVRGELSASAPSPECTQALIERLAEFEPTLVERVVASLPLPALDPHRASVFARRRGLWRAVAAIAAALGGASGAMRELTAHVSASCRGGGGGGGGGEEWRCGCAGDALLLVVADGLAGRGPAGRAMPDHARPSARHDALQTLLAEEDRGEGSSPSPAPLRALARHDARACVRLLEQGWREPPFVGPLGKQNRLRVARALLHYADDLPEEDRIDIVEFIAGQMSAGALPAEREVARGAAAAVAGEAGEAPVQGVAAERVDRALRLLGERAPHALPPAAAARPRIAWRTAAINKQHKEAMRHFFLIDRSSSADVDELFEYLQANSKDVKEELKEHLVSLVNLRPRATAALLGDAAAELATTVLQSSTEHPVIEFAECLLETGALQGDAVAAYLKNLCQHTPSKVKQFLAQNQGAVRPEDALRIVQEFGPREAEPVCLEAIGDPDRALAVTIELMSACESEPERARIVDEACALCGRVAASVPRETAVALWSRLLRAVPRVPPAAVLDAALYFPAETLLEYAYESPDMALRILRCGSGERALWQCVARTHGREAHAGSARALRAAARGVAVRANCDACDRTLSTGDAVCVDACAHAAVATHAACPARASKCVLCPRERSTRRLTLPQRAAAVRRETAPLHHELSVVAPPRPDLEGVV